MALSEAQTVCAQSGHLWLVESREEFTCDGTPYNVGFSAHVRIVTCGATGVCIIIIEHPCAEVAPCFETLATIEEALSTRYGLPGVRHRRVPSNCAVSTSELATCLTQERAHIESAWGWEHREALILKIEGESSLLVVVSYLGRELLKETPE